jgi:Ca2+-binding EF-hand superfamily protein
MSVITPRGRDRSSTLIENNYDPQLPKDMFGFPVELKYAAAYQDFLVTHLRESIKQNEKITEAIQEGIINTAIPKAQWGKQHRHTLRPQIFKKLLTKAPSSRDVLHLSSSVEKEKPPMHKVLTRSRSITEILRPDDNEILKMRERKEKEKEKEKERDGGGGGGNDIEMYRISRGRSNSDLKAAVAVTPPTNARLLQAIANLVDLSGPDEIVRNIIRGGIPSNYRAELWLAMSGVNQKLPVVKGVYATLLESMDKPPHLDSLAYEQIEKDLSRTFPGIDFTPAGHEFQPILRRILRAYAIRNPALGYCQSMNFIAGGLLIFMEEEHAFWTLCWIVEELLSGYFTKTMVGLQVDTALFEKLVKKYLPDLSKHLNKLGFSNIFCTVQWFLCMYLNNLPSEAAFRVWDLVFYAGTKVLFEVGLNIMKVFEPQIMRKRDAVDIASLLSKSLSSMFDISPFLSQNYLKNLTPDGLKAMQTALHFEVQNELRSRHDTLQMIELLRLTKFTKLELTELYQQFISLDPMLNEFGINIYVFKNMLPVAFPAWNKPDEYFCQKLFDALDCDHDSLVDFKDLMLGLSAIHRGTVKEKLHVCCRTFGATGTTRLHRSELQKILFSIYKLVEHSSDKVITREVNFFSDMFFKNDKNDEGISETTFKECILFQPAVVKCFNLIKINATTNVRLVEKNNFIK